MQKDADVTLQDYIRAFKLKKHCPKPEFIADLNWDIDCILDNPEAYYDPVGLVTELEFNLQEAWGFERNKDYHNRWWKMKGCTCPKLDNQERIGTPYKIISMDCPWHGKHALETPV